MLSLRLFERTLLVAIFKESVNLCIQDLEYVLYAADMLPRFYQIISWKKEKKLYTSFQQATRLRFTGISSR